ncbi:MAG: hypothetical protein FWH18_03440 [Marinilabiliaceae bacterium]|nr:hypothetical protein [Marinilabiliaceae bacterium]
MDIFLEPAHGAVLPPFLPPYSPKDLNVSQDTFLHSLADEIEAKGLGRPCTTREEIFAAIDDDRDVNFLIKTTILGDIVLALLTEEGLKNPAASRDEVMNKIKSKSSCVAREYSLVNTEVYEDALLLAMMEDAHDDESVSEEELIEFLRQR